MELSNSLSQDDRKRSWDCFVVVVEVLLYVHRNRRLIRDGSPGRPSRLSHSFELCFVVVSDRFYIALFSALEQTHCARM